MFPFLVPPEKPKIYDERAQEVRLKLGPYKIGDTVLLKCVANGGKKIRIIICKVYTAKLFQTIKHDTISQVNLLPNNNMAYLSTFIYSELFWILLPKLRMI